jgi:hypothetical protein
MELHLGDAYPRQLVFDRVSGSARSDAYTAYFIKGATGNNNTYTRLGDIAPITEDASFGYLVLFATERVTSEPSDGRIGGARDLAITRIRSNFAELDSESTSHLDEGLPHTQDVTSGGTALQNRVRFLTDHAGEGDVHAERPKLLPIGGRPVHRALRALGGRRWHLHVRGDPRAVDRRGGRVSSWATRTSATSTCRAATTPSCWARGRLGDGRPGAALAHGAPRHPSGRRAGAGLEPGALTAPPGPGGRVLRSRAQAATYACRSNLRSVRGPP